MTTLIADSGSTKTHWRWINDEGKYKDYFTSGINPFIRTEEECLALLEEELPKDECISNVDQLIFYGAGVKNDIKANEMIIMLRKYFTHSKVDALSDMLGAARALCGKEPGICGILGTGSNSCFYDGENISSNNPSLGYILGDEGSGTHLGKQVLRYYFYQTFDPELMIAFETKFGNNLTEILENIYKGKSPNKYIANFASFLVDHRGHYMIENIIEDCFTGYHENHILKYRGSWQFPVHFIGGVAYEFQDVIKSLHNDYGLTTGKIIQSPMDGLVAYHELNAMAETH